jgi:hypothetical protein
MAPLDCRMVDAGFYHPGLPHLGIEASIAMTNKLIMHFDAGQALRPSSGCPTASCYWNLVSRSSPYKAHINDSPF